MAEYEIKDGVGIIPEGTTRIPYESFKDCKELTKIVMRKSKQSKRNFINFAETKLRKTENRLYITG